MMSEVLRIGVFGDGRLGRAIARRLEGQLAWQVTREPPPPAVVDAVIEVSSGDAVRDRLEWSLANEVPLVIGSTGWDLPELDELVGDRIGVVVAPNFSLGVELLRRVSLVLARLASRDATRDPYIVEHHQARKHDAPSGTAKMLAATVLKACDRKQTWRMGGPVADDELSVAVLRAGSTYSEHRVGLDAPAEVLELRHTARSADAFVDGALAAVRWIQSRRGVFTMGDVASRELDSLFAATSGETT